MAGWGQPSDVKPRDTCCRKWREEQGDLRQLRQDVEGGAGAVATATHELIVVMATILVNTRWRCYDLEQVSSILTDYAARTPRR